MSATIRETRAETRGAARARAAAGRSRVVIVSDCSSFRPPFSAGGTEQQLSALARQLECCGVEVTVMVRECADGPGGRGPDASADLRTAYVAPAPVPKGRGWAALGPNLRFIANTMRILRRTRGEYDALIVSGFRQLAPPLALLARLLRKRCILRIEAAWDLDDEISPESGARIGRSAMRLITASIRVSRRVAFRLTDYLVAFSEPLEQRLLRLGAGREKVKRIPNGVDTQRFAPVAADEKAALRARLGLPADRTVFVYTGRVCRSKGLIDLMQVWERLAGRGAHLLIVGSGAGSHESCEAEVRDMASRYPRSIALRGRVGNVAQYLQASDAFIFLSYFETFSLSILEAVCTGLPCIVSDVGCARQVVRHHENGAIVPTHAPPDAVLEEIEWLQAHRGEWAAMGALGRASVEREFGLAAVAARYVALCGAPGPSRP
jgi:glycosyltransferase involved in cell wall biosynthesis